MDRLVRQWRKEISRRLTIMVIPHGIARPRQLSFSVPFVAFMFFAWTAFTGWAGMIASERFDYWRAKANTHFLKLKLEFFNKQLNESRAMLDEVKELESELRSLMALGSRDAIIQTEALRAPAAASETRASGGPTLADAAVLERMLNGNADFSFDDIAKDIQTLRREAETRLAGARDIAQKIETERQLYKSTPNLWPALGYLTSHFGNRLSPIDGFVEAHKGMDIAGPPGTPIRATADGVVKLAGWAGGYGKVIVVDHGMGYSTRYGHNRQILVKNGDRVKRGQIIATMGETGNATGPHCHYEVWYNGRAINPGKFLKKHTS